MSEAVEVGVVDVEALVGRARGGAQVGEVLGKSEGAVRVAQHRALTALRELMEVTVR